MLFPAMVPESTLRRGLRLGGEAVVVTGLSIYLPVLLGFEEPGLISLFLVAAALSGSFGMLLEENRVNIWEKRVSGWRSNQLTVVGFLALFGGMFVGYALAASLLEEGRLVAFFGFAIDASALGQEAIQERNFGSVLAILRLNAGVLLAIACLAFIYRGYGAMLALGWNACVWAIVITILVLRGTASSALPRPAAIVLALGAVLPHLILESLAYAASALAFLFASKGLSTYPLGDARLRQVMVASAVLLAVGAGALILGAVVETYFPPAVLRYL